MGSPILSESIGEAPLPGFHPWYALKVRARGERKVKQALEQKGCEVFLPMRLECRRYPDRLKKVEIAMFSGYLFCRFDFNRRLPVLLTPGVEYVVTPFGHKQPVEEAEINAIRRAVQSGRDVEPWPYLEAGDQVQIKCGALAGLAGPLVRHRGSERLVLSVHALQRSIAVAIDRS